MIKIEYIMTKNMVENVLKKNVSLYTNKILLIFILIFTPITIFVVDSFVEPYVSKIFFLPYL